jgi:hypothetical protein
MAISEQGRTSLVFRRKELYRVPPSDLGVKSEAIIKWIQFIFNPLWLPGFRGSPFYFFPYREK